MTITDVRIRLIEGESRLKAVASIVIDGAFAIHELRIIEGREGLFVAMPSKKIGEGKFKDIAHPISKEARTDIEKTILEKYQETIA